MLTPTVTPITRPTTPGWYIWLNGRWCPTDQLTFRTWVNTIEVR
jgi:hypothetical protein